jgi:iodotyrosine deiodinase
MTRVGYIPLTSYRECPPEEMLRRAAVFCEQMQRRRSVREFSSRAVPREIIEQCILAAGSAPSGANRQPWHFAVVGDPTLKRQIREAAERGEYEFYHDLAAEEWLAALSPLGTDHHKPFLETAPWLIAVFAQKHGLSPDGGKVQHYFVRESVGIAIGILITAVHHAGLVALPYTPSRSAFLNTLLGRPDHERPVMILVVGYPAENTLVPDIRKKPLNEIATFL